MSLKVGEKKVVEDASQLILGDDFQTKALCLWNAEVSIILERRLDVEHAGPDSTAEDLTSPTGHTNEIIKQTLDYVRLFSNYKNREAMGEAKLLGERMCKSYKLDPFEVAVINNLNIETVEEALSLIPTLKDKFSDEKELEKFLDDLKRFQTT